MMSIRKLLSKQGFSPRFVGMFINPFYFARKGLYEAIKSYAHNIQGKILDVGCGNKPYKHLFNVSSYIGLDYDKDGTNKNPDADFIYDGTIFPFENEVYDSLICNEVLEHVFNPDQFISEINRVLKLGGTLLITVPFVWDEHDQPYDYARYSSFGLKHILEKHGFEIMMHKKSMNDIRVIFQLINTYIHKIFLKNNNHYIEIILTMLLCSPFNILGSFLGWILPKNNDLYLDNIVLAKKVSQ
jgi:SAM-dependent methyltransferase